MATRLVTLADENGESVTFRYTDKQLVFIERYLDTLNGTKAAKLAGYSGNANTLSTIAWENLRKPKIAMLIKQRMAVECMSATESLRHLASIARGVDITQYFTTTVVETEEGEYAIHSFDIDKLREDGHGGLIKSITPTRSGVKIEFIDRLGALNSIARHHALFTDVIIGAQVDKTDKELLDNDEREQFAASIMQRIIDRRK